MLISETSAISSGILTIAILSVLPIRDRVALLAVESPDINSSAKTGMMEQ
jgi:hypothetical protein